LRTELGTRSTSGPALIAELGTTASESRAHRATRHGSVSGGTLEDFPTNSFAGSTTRNVRLIQGTVAVALHAGDCCVAVLAVNFAITIAEISSIEDFSALATLKAAFVPCLVKSENLLVEEY